MSELVRAALRYTALGLKVFPTKRDKSPATPNGVKNATIDEKQLRRWFGNRINGDTDEPVASSYNVAVTGGFFVDVDPRNGGELSEKRLLKLVPELADAPIVETGGGGRHYWYAATDGARSTTLPEFPGIDFIAAGKYVVAPPSRHGSGLRYKWIREPSGRLPPAPEKLLALFQQVKTKLETALRQPFHEVPPASARSGKIPEGHRNKDLYRYACGWRARGANEQEILALARTRNVKKYEPPLDDHELVRTVKSATGHQPGPELTGTWKDLLLRTKKGHVDSCVHNGILALHHDKRITLRWNEVTKDIEVSGALSDSHGDTLATNTAAWLHSQHEIKLPPHLAGNCLLSEARKHPYDPVKEYLRNLTWDRKDRLATAASDYLGTDDPFADTAFKKWMISAVARALRPGCQADHVLVLEGAQGARKSSAARVLGGKWACDTELVLGDKDSRLLAASAWIVELAEIASLKRSEIDRQKAFLSAVNDKFRPPYAAKVGDFPRRCVFIGSTNEVGDYLIDNTGNRRFWPIHVGTIALDDLIRDRDQLWAEAVVMFDAGEKWWLEGEEENKAAEEATQKRTREQPLVSIISDWYLRKDPDAAPHEKNARPDSSRTVDVARALGLDATNERHVIQIGKALKQLECERKQHRTASGREWRYHWPARMRSAPQSEAGKRAALNGAAKALSAPSVSRSRTIRANN